MQVPLKPFLRRAYVELLKSTQERISVSDVAEKCGVSRNAFYYQYDGMPDLIQDTVMDWLNTKHPEVFRIPSLWVCYQTVLDYAEENLPIALHICTAINWRMMMRTLALLGQKIRQRYEEVQGASSSQGDFYEHAFMGAALAWLGEKGVFN